MTTETLELRRAREGSLTWRASLNLAQSVLDYGAKLAVGLIVIPILVTGLGRSLFGVWEMLGRLMGYMESTDGRPTQALRLVISHQQSQNELSAKRRWVGSALVVWLCFLPLWTVTGAILIWLAPTITKVPPALTSTVRITCALAMTGVLVAALASLPESVLRGMNLGYKRMGLQAGLSVMGGLLMAGAVYLGWGLIGVAGAGVVLALATGLCFLMVVRHQVPWFGVERPRRSEVVSLLRMSLWIAGGDVVAKLLLASDVLVIGTVMSASNVTTYVLTGYAALLAVNLYALAADAVMPGLAGIIGQKDYARAAQLRRELLAVTALFVTAVGSAILLWNRSFVHLWVGGENYAGSLDQSAAGLNRGADRAHPLRRLHHRCAPALSRDCCVRVSAVAAVIALALSVALTWYAGLVGLVSGRSGRPRHPDDLVSLVVSDCLERTPALQPLAVPHLAVTAGLFAGSAYLGEQVVLQHWSSGLLRCCSPRSGPLRCFRMGSAGRSPCVGTDSAGRALERLGHRDFRSGAL